MGAAFQMGAFPGQNTGEKHLTPTAGQCTLGNHCPWPQGHTAGSWPTVGQPLINQDLQVLLHRAPFQQLSPSLR